MAKIVLGVQGASPDKAQENAERYLLCSLAGKFRRKFRSKSVCALLSANARGKKWTRSGRITQLGSIQKTEFKAR